VMFPVSQMCPPHENLHKASMPETRSRSGAAEGI